MRNLKIGLLICAAIYLTMHFAAKFERENGENVKPIRGSPVLTSSSTEPQTANIPPHKVVDMKSHADRSTDRTRRTGYNEIREGIEKFDLLLAAANRGDQKSIELLIDIVIVCAGDKDGQVSDSDCKKIPEYILKNPLGVYLQLHSKYPQIPQLNTTIAGMILNAGENNLASLESLNIFTTDQARTVALKHLNAALEQRSVKSAVMLASIFRFGILGSADSERAYGYALVAEDLGYKYPQGYLQDIQSQLNAAQLSAATRLKDDILKDWEAADAGKN